MLAPPHPPRPSARIKREADDWIVVEEPGDDLAAEIRSGVGEHLYLWVEKRRENTADVAREIASQLGLPRSAVGYAGRKDKHGVTRQWFSAHTHRDDMPEGERFEVLECGRAPRKLRPGQLARNSFRIVMRDLDELPENCLRAPFPNFFGPQRFGGTNVDDAIDWVLHRRSRKVAPAQRGWHLSVLRAHLFNAVLTLRLKSHAVTDSLPGDVLLDGAATGPLWGRGRSPSADEALAIEQAALAEFAGVCEALEYAGVDQGRRKLWSQAEDLDVVYDAAARSAELSFALEPGVYATVLLAQCLAIVDESVDAAA